MNGLVVTELGAKADPARDVITVEGRAVDVSAGRTYIMLNKPRGYASTRRDPHAARTVLDLVKGLDVYLYPAGRLDVDTEGLLILTNDGDLAHRLTHPAHEVWKQYRAVTVGSISPDAVERLHQGILLEDGLTSPAEARAVRVRPPTPEEVRRCRSARLPATDSVSEVEIRIREGRKRQVRRMLAAVGHPVIQLTRTAVGSLRLGNLPVGQWRRLTDREIAALRAESGASNAE